MREYGQVQCSFWTDPDVQGLSDSSTLLAVYLLTGPHSNGIGCYRLPDGYIQADLGWSPETINESFSELLEAGFAYRCQDTGFVVIPKFLRWNRIANGNVATARQREFESIPKKFRYYSLAVQSLMEYGAHWSEDFITLLQTVRGTVTETDNEGYAKQDPIRSDPDPDPIEKDAPAKSERSAPHKIPDDWQPNEVNRQWLTDAGMTPAEQAEVIDEFRRWARNSDHRKANWDLAFSRNPAVKSAVGRRKTNGKASNRDRPKSATERTREGIKRYFEQQGRAAE